MSPTLSDVIKRTSRLTNSVLVALSTGKDSLVTLDLCLRYIPHVEAFFMYWVKGLSWQDNFLNYLSNRYHGLVIHQLPHWGLGNMFRYATFRPHTRATMQCPKLKINDIEVKLRQDTGIQWLAYGHTIYESLQRRGMLKQCNAVDTKTKRCYPVAWFTRRHIRAYIKSHQIQLPIDYHLFGKSFGTLDARQLIPIKERFPSDYEKIKEVFPYVEAEIKRQEWFGNAVDAESISKI